MSLAVIIVNWNGYEVTRQTILSLEKTNYQNYDIIIVDNASSDGSGQKIKEAFPAVKVIFSETNRGFAGGNNLGIQYALTQKYKYLLLLNNDVEVEPDFIEPLIASIESSPTIGAVQPLIYFHHDKERVWNAGGRFNPILGNTRVLDYNKTDASHALRNSARSIDWITGCAILIKTEVIKKVGLLDECYFMYYEDVDWSLQIRKHGYDLAFVPRSVIYHIAGHSLTLAKANKEGKLSPNTHYYSIRSRILFLKKYTPIIYMPTTLIYQSIYIALVSTYFICRGRWKKWTAFQKGIWHGLIQNTQN